MLTPDDFPEPDPVPPECRATAGLIQRVLDGDAAPGALEADPHAAACPACRQRVRAARALLAMFAAPREPVAVPAGFAKRVTERMWAERHARTRLRSFVGACAAIAAGLLLLAGLGFLFDSKPEPLVPAPSPQLPDYTAKHQGPEVAPAPHSKTAVPAPQPRTIRLADELAKAEQKLLEVPKPLAESAAVAPKLFDAIGSALKLPDMANDPMANALEPARKSLSELPGAAQAGLEPVTGTAEKAFKRFLSDVGAVKPRS
jgi:hypothetical protein